MACVEDNDKNNKFASYKQWVNDAKRIIYPQKQQRLLNINNV